MLGKLLRSAGIPIFGRANVARAIYRGILNREPDEAEIDGLLSSLNRGNTDEVFQEIIRSHEFQSRIIGMLPSHRLPDLKAVIPGYHAVETTEYGEDMSVFRGESDADFNLLEDLFQKYRYYDIPGVWGWRIDVDKKVTAAIAHGLGAKSCLELGCFTGPVLSILADAGVTVTGLEASHLAFVLGYPNVRNRMIFGDLLTAKVESDYDVVLAMDVLEHLNPVKLGSYFHRIASIVAARGYVYVNSPMIGSDDVFGTVFPRYLREWSSVGDSSYWRHLDCDSLGWPKHGHLVWASPAWWERGFRASGLVRDRKVEEVIHRRLEKFFEIAPARKCLFVLKHEGGGRRSDEVGEQILAAIDMIDQPV